MASVANLDDLALRTSAIAGQVPGTGVTLEGRTHSANRVLMDSVRTILGTHSIHEDAQSVRNSTNMLGELANGSASSPR